MTETVRDSSMQELLEDIGKVREMLFKASGSAFLAGEKCHPDDRKAVYDLVCRANVWLISITDDVAALQSQVNTDGWNPVRYTDELVRDICEMHEPGDGAFAANVDLNWLRDKLHAELPKAPQQVSNTPQEQALGYIDRVQLERWEKLRGSQYASKEIGYIGFSREPFQTELTDCTLAVYTAPPQQQEAQMSADEAANIMLYQEIDYEWRAPEETRYTSRRWCNFIGEHVIGYGSTPLKAAIASNELWKAEQRKYEGESDE
jgi:hypothetical protein